MAFKTTIKVALLTGAAKDDTFTTEATGLSEEMLSAFLNVLANDPGSATLYSLQQDLTGIDQMTAVSTAVSLLGATITIQADGTIKYDASNIDTLNQLVEGEFATDTFVYTVRMSNGALSTAIVTLEIAGINDAARIWGKEYDNVFEDSNFPFREGTLTVIDPDTGEDSFVIASELSGTYGDFTFDTESGYWTYTLRNDDPVVDALARYEERFDTLAVISKDGSDSEVITIRIAGRNDVPTLELIQAINILDTDADDTPLPKTGTLAGEDVDNNATLTYSLTDGVTSGTGAETKQTEYGTLTLLTETGAYSFLADPDKIDSLVKDRTEVVNFTVTVTDEHYFTASQTMTFNLIGVNDTAVITSLEVVEDSKGGTSGGGTGTSVTEIDHARGTVTEDEGTWTVSDKISVSDRDEGQSSFATVSDSDLKGTYGDFTFTADGAWTYTLRNGDNNVQALGETAHPTDTLRVYSLDGSASQDIVVTVNGSHDDTLNLNVGLKQFDPATWAYSIDVSSAQITALHLLDGITVEGREPVDLIPDANNQNDSLRLTVSIPDSTGIGHIQGEISLIGATYLFIA